MAITPDALARQWFEEVWNNGREELIDALMAPHAVIHGLETPDGRSVDGADAFKPFFRVFRQAFPDIHVTVERTVTEGEFAVAYCHVAGTHSGADLGVPSTGRRISINGMLMARVENGRLVEGWNCFDFLRLYQQLGLVAGPAGA